MLQTLVWIDGGGLSLRMSVFLSTGRQRNAHMLRVLTLNQNCKPKIPSASIHMVVLSSDVLKRQTTKRTRETKAFYIPKLRNQPINYLL